MILKNRISALATVLFWLVTLGLCLPSADAWAQQRRGGSMTFLRDAEAEDIIRGWATPLFNAAGLQAESVQVYLIDNNAINAFVAGGQRIFIHTGLILASENANQIMGVIAHETGHIAGGHLVRLQEELRGLTPQTILTMLAGAAVAAAGRPDAGMAVIAGGTTVAERNMLSYSRIQESAADQAGASFLERAQKSGQGLVRFLQILGEQDALLSDNQDPYVRSHPLSRERIRLLEDIVAKSRWAKQVDPPEEQERYARLKAKLRGYVDPSQAVRLYPASDTSLAARYGRSVAYYRSGDMPRALAELDALLAQRPNDPYFLELKGDILFRGGRAAESLEPYRRAIDMLPDAVPIRAAFGEALLATEGDANVKPAIEQLRHAVRREPQNGSAWASLAQAYGRGGDVAMASLASAEQFVLGGRWRDAILQAGRAERMLPVGSPGHLRAQDIKNSAENEIKKAKSQ